MPLSPNVLRRTRGPSTELYILPEDGIKNVPKKHGGFWFIFPRFYATWLHIYTVPSADQAQCSTGSGLRPPGFLIYFDFFEFYQYFVVVLYCFHVFCLLLTSQGEHVFLLISSTWPSKSCAQKPQPSADNRNLCLYNSSCPSRPHSIIVYYMHTLHRPSKSARVDNGIVFDCF